MMKNAWTTVALLIFSAVPLAAQSSEVGLLIGGTKRLISHTDEERGLGISDNFKFSNSDREIYYAVQLDPGTWFKIRAGQIEGPVAFQYRFGNGNFRTDIPKGKVEHIDAAVDYKFSEPFGATGLFAGVGLFRQSGTITEIAVPADQRGRATETNYGFLGGVNGDFPITARIGFIVEATYYWIPYDYKVRYITVGGGLRFNF